MILRYSVETKHKPSFTAKKICKDIEDAYRKIQKLKDMNSKEGYVKYSGFLLYDNSNTLIPPAKNGMAM